jgi:glycosyltransferase involved in cell wall biosynthesis
MPAPLSIIIPMLNAEAELPLCLESLMPGLEAGLIREVIVADGGSEDATAKIAGAMGANLVTGARGRGAQLAAGAGAARGDWLMFLHADTALSRDWAERTSESYHDQTGSSAFFELRYRSDARAARTLEKRANRRARNAGPALWRPGPADQPEAV